MLSKLQIMSTSRILFPNDTEFRFQELNRTSNFGFKNIFQALAESCPL